jgi:hypothetical protein
MYEKGKDFYFGCLRLSSFSFLAVLILPRFSQCNNSVSNLGGEHSIMFRMRRSLLILPAVFVASSAFTFPNQKSAMIHNTFEGRTSNLRMLPDASSLLTAVQVSCRRNWSNIGSGCICYPIDIFGLTNFSSGRFRISKVVSF